VPLIRKVRVEESVKVNDQTSRRSPENSRRAAAPLRQYAFVSTFILLGLSGLLLGSCSSVSNYTSDHWPTWAGGMPKDVPPRPGAPGYDEFLAHQQGRDAAATSPPADANAQPTSVIAAPDKANGAASPVNRPVDNSGVVQGGLY
jgi:hypothetical protein